jgi:hypothetical protein
MWRERNSPYGAKLFIEFFLSTTRKLIMVFHFGIDEQFQVSILYQFNSMQKNLIYP